MRSLASFTSGEEIDILRLNANGTPDLTFGTNGRYVQASNPNGIDSASGLFADLTPIGWLQGDGKIVTMYQRGTGFEVLRLNPDGTPDQSVGPGGAASFAGIPASGPWLQAPGEYYGWLGAWGGTPTGGIAYVTLNRQQGRLGTSSQVIRVRF